MADESRREFIQAAAGAALLAEQVIAQTSSASATGLPTRVLGRSGVRVSVIGLGGWHIGSVKDDNEATRIMHAAIDEGLTFFDNAWDYHDGRSEELMGKALAMDGRRIAKVKIEKLGEQSPPLVAALETQEPDPRH